MSFSLDAYLIDLRELQSFLGCRDPRRIEAVLAAISGKYPFPSGEWEKQEELQLTLTINSLAAGRRDGYDPSMVVMAIRALCHTFGTEQDSDKFSHVQMQIFDHCGKGLEPLIFRGHPPPFNQLHFTEQGDERSIGYLTYSEVPPLLVEAEAILEGLEGESLCLYDSVLTMIGWYEGAIAENRDLVGFSL